MKEKLIKFLCESLFYTFDVKTCESKLDIKKSVDNLLAAGVIVPPCKTVYRIVDKGTPFAMVMPKSVDELTLFELKNLSKHGYYTSREEAEKHLK